MGYNVLLSGNFKVVRFCECKTSAALNCPLELFVSSFLFFVSNINMY